jgi:hypothetical protein
MHRCPTSCSGPGFLRAALTPVIDSINVVRNRRDSGIFASRCARDTQTEYAAAEKGAIAVRPAVCAPRQSDQ